MTAPQRTQADEQAPERITRAVWLAAAKDFVIAVACAAFVIVALDQWLVLLATLAITGGWTR